MPIALSIVEGCAQSPHRHWSTGVVEWWSDGSRTQYSNTPLLQLSISFARLASEIFLSGLQSTLSRALRRGK
jgi:hypothetical protein